MNIVHLDFFYFLVSEIESSFMSQAGLELKALPLPPEW